jgi:hypothetical protein
VDSAAPLEVSDADVFLSLAQYLTQGSGGEVDETLEATAAKRATVGWQRRAAPQGEAREGEAMSIREWNVVIITHGLSDNGCIYRRDILKESVSRFADAPVFAHDLWIQGQHFYDHLREAEEPYRQYLVRDLVGFITKPQWNGERVSGILHFLPHNKGLADRLTEGYTRGSFGALGLSINSAGPGRPVAGVTRPQRWVESIEAVNSVDFASIPAAGGRIIGPSGQMPIEVKAAQVRARQAEALRVFEPRVVALEARAEAYCQRRTSRLPETAWDVRRREDNRLWRCYGGRPSWAR